MEYSVIVHPAGLLDVETAGYWTEVTELPACACAGATLEQAVANTRAAIAHWLAQHGQATAPDALKLNIKVAC